MTTYTAASANTTRAARSNRSGSYTRVQTPIRAEYHVHEENAWQPEPQPTRMSRTERNAGNERVRRPAAAERVQRKETTEKKEPWWERAIEWFMVAHLAMHFVPILTSLGWLVYLISGMNDTVLGICAPFMLLGYISIVLTHPLRFLWRSVKFIAKCAWKPLTVVPFFPLNFTAAALGLGIGLTIRLGALFFAPALYSIPYYMEDDEEE